MLDGDIRSCAKGTFQKDHWMRVDLGVPRVVAKVVISHKRIWIDGLEVWIGEFRTTQKRRSNMQLKLTCPMSISDRS